MRKGKAIYDDDLYDDDYYDDDYGDDYYEEEEEEEKPKKKSKKPAKPENNPVTQNKPNKQQNQKNNNNQNKQQTNTNKNQNTTNSNTITENKEKKEEKENKEIKNITELNKLIYPKIEYSSKYTNSQEEKDPLNLVIIGHVDSGKSTLVGCLLKLLGLKNQNKTDKKSKKGNNQNDIPDAFVTDEASDERERGVTIDIGYKSFSTDKKFVCILDAPGHRDFIPNMISGTSAADAGILVIDSGTQAFDAGFYREGQTREHALLAKTLGISQLIVAVNKLEIFDWKESRFTEICEQLKKFLINEVGFEEKNLFFIPVSGITGGNLNSPIESEGGKWYKGPTLIQLIDQIESPKREINSPVRFIISDISTGSVNGPQGVNIFGKLECGIIDSNSEYVILPHGNKYKLKSISVNGKNVKFITPGLQAEIKLNTLKNSKEENVIEVGNVLSSVKYSIPVVKEFKAHIKTYDIKIPITLGKKMMFYLQGQKTQISVKKIEKIFNEGSQISKTNTRFIPKNFYADVIIQCEKAVCCELFTNNKRLSTFTLRTGGATDAIGYITEFLN